jgi:hypothetical protein
MKLSTSAALGSCLGYRTLALLARGIFLKPALLSIVLMENLSQEESVQGRDP